MRTAARLVQTSLHTVNDADKQLLQILDFPFNKLLGTEEVTPILWVDDDMIFKYGDDFYLMSEIEGTYGQAEYFWKVHEQDISCRFTSRLTEVSFNDISIF